MVVEVVRVGIERDELTAEKIPALRDLFRLERLPLAESRVEIEIRGVPTAVVNALRRVVTDEMPGFALQVPADGFDASETSEAFMLPQPPGKLALFPDTLLGIQANMVQSEGLPNSQSTTPLFAHPEAVDHIDPEYHFGGNVAHTRNAGYPPF
jgi:hypothetical protein